MPADKRKNANQGGWICAAIQLNGDPAQAPPEWDQGQPSGHGHEDPVFFDDDYDDDDDGHHATTEHAAATSVSSTRDAGTTLAQRSIVTVTVHETPSTAQSGVDEEGDTVTTTTSTSMKSTQTTSVTGAGAGATGTSTPTTHGPTTAPTSTPGAVLESESATRARQSSHSSVGVSHATGIVYCPFEGRPDVYTLCGGPTAAAQVSSASRRRSGPRLFSQLGAGLRAAAAAAGPITAAATSFRLNAALNLVRPLVPLMGGGSGGGGGVGVTEEKRRVDDEADRAAAKARLRESCLRLRESIDLAIDAASARREALGEFRSRLQARRAVGGLEDRV